MTTQVQTKKKRVRGVKIHDAIRVMTEQYGPFEEEPRLDPVHELVFTILSQHTSDINSARAFGFLMEEFGSLEAVARGTVAVIEKAISPGGLAKVKAPRIKLVLTRILELNGTLDLSFLREMPLDEAKAWLRQLPGIGPKSAGIILNFSLGMPAMAVDTHIYRVCQRLRFIGPKVTVEKAHEILEAKVPPEQVFQFHVAIINHGRRVCKAQRPLCVECVVAEECPSRTKMMKVWAAKNTTGKSNTTAKKAKNSRNAGPIMPHAPADQAADSNLKDQYQ